LFLDCIKYAQSNHSHADDGEGLVETVVLLATYLKDRELPIERPWETIFAIRTRILALSDLVKAKPIAGLSLTEVNDGIIWSRMDLLRASATMPLRKNASGKWIFEHSQFEYLMGDEMPPKPYDWDPQKAAQNFEKHGVAFTHVINFDWATAIEAEDTRYDYGETRMQALGKIDGRYHVLVYSVRADRIRVISLRKANRRETP